MNIDAHDIKYIVNSDCWGLKYLLYDHSIYYESFIWENYIILHPKDVNKFFDPKKNLRIQ